jgi:hypothetical protein
MKILIKTNLKIGTFVSRSKIDNIPIVEIEKAELDNISTNLYEVILKDRNIFDFTNSFDEQVDVKVFGSHINSVNMKRELDISHFILKSKLKENIFGIMVLTQGDGDARFDMPLIFSQSMDGNNKHFITEDGYYVHIFKFRYTIDITTVITKTMKPLSEFTLELVEKGTEIV